MLFHLTPSALADGYGEALLSLAVAKQHLRIDADNEDEDILVAVLRDAAIDGVEKYCNERLGPCTGIVATFEGFDRRAGMRLGVGPDFSVSVTAVSYSSNGAMVEMDPSAWTVGAGGMLGPAYRTSWPRATGVVNVTFDAGYPAGLCPPALMQATRLLLGHLFKNREAVVSGVLSGELPLGVTWWCDQVRMPVL